jgi:tape measure domain protein
VITLGSNLQQSQIAFETMLQSGEKAQALLSQLSDFASKTPFELTGIRQTAQQLLAMGISAEDMVPTLKAL